jgi:hypothetical protein
MTTSIERLVAATTVDTISNCATLAASLAQELRQSPGGEQIPMAQYAEVLAQAFAQLKAGHEVERASLRGLNGCTPAAQRLAASSASGLVRRWEDGIPSHDLPSWADAAALAMRALLTETT